MREDRGDFWFFVVLSGRVRFSRAGRTVGEAGPGQHFGHQAVLGLRPQKATATAIERTALVVLSAQYVLSLLSDCPRFQQDVFPDVRPADYRDFARQMHRLGREEWREVGDRLPARRVLLSAPSAVPRRDRPPGRHLTLREAAARFVDLPAPSPAGPSGTVTDRALAPSRVPAWAPMVAAALLGVGLSLLLLCYHPPSAVVTPGQPVDITADLTVAGRPAVHPSGRYLLVTVRVTRPALGRYLLARLRGTDTIPVQDGRLTRSQRRAAERDGRAAYLDSQRTAVMVAERAAGLDPATVSVQIRDRGFVGPSGGLVYALAVSDVLTGRDCSAGRTVVATGSLDTAGRVGPVGWVAVKLRPMHGPTQPFVLVPAGEEDGARHAGRNTVGVTTFRAALDATCRPAPPQPQPQPRTGGM